MEGSEREKKGRGEKEGKKGIEKGGTEGGKGKKGREPERKGVRPAHFSDTSAAYGVRYMYVKCDFIR